MKYTRTEIDEAIHSIESIKAKCEKVLQKLKKDTSQWTLTVRRIKAFEIALKALNTKVNIAILVSGGGTNMMSVIEAIERRELNARIALVVASNHTAGAIAKAKVKKIPTEVCALSDYSSREERDQAILAHLKKHNVQLVVLAGYLGIVTNCLLDTYKGKIINIHPSLLPKHGGAGMHGLTVHESVIRAGDKITGATVHYVSAEIDGGDIILQRSLPVLDSDTPETLAKRVLEKVEHGLLVDAIDKILREEER